MDETNASNMQWFDGETHMRAFESNAQDIFNDNIDLSGCKGYNVIDLDFTELVKEEERRNEERMKGLRRNCVLTAIVGGIIFGLAAWKKKV